jgi:hypothetical protein
MTGFKSARSLIAFNLKKSNVGKRKACWIVKVMDSK